MKGMNSPSTPACSATSSGRRFERDIIVLTDCDEEAGDTGQLAGREAWGKLKAGMVLTEGGWFLAQPDKTTPMLITVTRQDKVYFDRPTEVARTHSRSLTRTPPSPVPSELEGWPVRARRRRGVRRGAGRRHGR